MQKSLKKNRFGQYLLAAVFGVVSGCLGAFTVVSLYSHRMVSFGALAAAMIETSGDEFFKSFSYYSCYTVLDPLAIVMTQADTFGCKQLIFMLESGAVWLIVLTVPGQLMTSYLCRIKEK